VVPGRPSGVGRVGSLHAALEGYGVALLRKYTVQGKVSRGDLFAPLPGLRLVEDWFCVYQKRVRAGREKNRVLTDFLLHLDVGEFGDAIRPPEGGLSRRRRSTHRG
jgi:hypothetical protein